MLVLSRKEADRILFPSLGITIEVLRIRGNTARIGIDAPADVPVLRHEVAELKSLWFSSEEDPKEQLRQLIHAVRGRTDQAADLLNSLHKHLEAVGDASGQQLVLEVFAQLRGMEADAGEVVERKERRAPRVLLVEDDANERGLLASYLQMRGIEMTTAQDGQDAIDFLSLHALPDVVLLDMHMPRCDGRQLVESIRADAAMRRVKLFAVSGTDPRMLGVPDGAKGVDRWYAKPVDPERLVDGITSEVGVPVMAV